MVIDRSAIVAIARNEADAADLEGRIADDPVRLISAAAVLESIIVLETRLGDVSGREFHLWLLKIGAEVIPVMPNRPMRSVRDDGSKHRRSHGKATRAERSIINQEEH
jgi:uncharacterized protein with PIN domain